MIAQGAVAAARHATIGSMSCNMDLSVAVARPACGISRLSSNKISPGHNASAFATGVRGAVPPPG